MSSFEMAFLSGMSLVAKVKKIAYLLGSVTQFLKQASFSVDENKHRTMHGKKRDSIFTHQQCLNLKQIQDVTAT